MKNYPKKVFVAALFVFIINSCEKQHGSGSEVTGQNTADYAASVNDSVSSTATFEVPGKKFVNTADVNMEVKDVYDATISIEQYLKELGGFVTQSRLQSHVISEKTYEISDRDAVVVKKYQTDNTMQVRVPTQKLGDFLTFINTQKVFLNSRIIDAEDVTANAIIAEMELAKLKKTGAVISQMKNNGEKVDRTENNLQQKNNQEISNSNLADHLKYATINIYINEPKIRVAEIAVTNSKNMDDRYKFNFFYDFKNAIVQGFYLIQKLFIALMTVWPVILILSIISYFQKEKKFPLLTGLVK